MYPHITKHIFDEWQEIWNCCAGNKLHAIKPTVGGYKQKTYVLNIVVSCRHICLRLSHLLSIDCCSISTYWHKLKYCVSTWLAAWQRVKCHVYLWTSVWLKCLLSSPCGCHVI